MNRLGKRIHIDATRLTARCERCGEAARGSLPIMLRFSREHACGGPRFDPNQPPLPPTTPSGRK